MVAIKRAIEPYQKQAAKGRQGGKGKKQHESSGNLPQRSRDIIAKFVGVGERTLQKAEDIVKKAEQIVTAAEQQPEIYQKKYGLTK